MAQANPAKPPSLPPLPASGLPPKGDPRRPVLLAVRTMRVLCVLLFLAAVIMGWRTFSGNTKHITLGDFAQSIGIYLIPGFVYLVCIFGLLERRLWAVVLALVAANLHLIACIILFFALLRSASAEPIALVIAGLWVLAIGQLVWHLAKSVNGIRFDMAGRVDPGPRGFDVTPKGR
jgi:hypothetical protein